MEGTRKHGYWIFRPYITLRNGRVLWAHWYGLRAFRIWVSA
jgi:hypothetical protein